uniref:Putative ovule protein n=1 Tax=Solanum chacoense TaxID=4108 RepID=A0A0V0GPN5_SOLCH
MYHEIQACLWILQTPIHIQSPMFLLPCQRLPMTALLFSHPPLPVTSFNYCSLIEEIIHHIFFKCPKSPTCLKKGCI